MLVSPAAGLWALCVLAITNGVKAKIALEEAAAHHIDAQNALVKSHDEIGSYFGFSVAGHVEVTPSGVSIPWLLVGAPLGQNVQPGTNRSGALFKCPVSDGDCTQVITDQGNTTIVGEITRDKLSAPGPRETKDNQWMGSTVRSGGPGGKAIVCAHRYIEEVYFEKNNDTDYVGSGLCYIYPNNLNRTSAWTLSPCSKRGVDCQFGLSAAIANDQTVLVGAPLHQDYPGAVYQFTYYPPKNNYLFKTTSNFLKSKVSSSMGMAITYGHYFDRNKTAFAVSISRWESVGAVFVYASVNDTRPVQIIGNNVGSHFGYEVITADVNGDLWPDLLVGAPMYFKKRELNGARRDINGAVFVYHNQMLATSPFRNKHSTKLTGSSAYGFGLAMANLGDLNNDGCDDIAIGDPYNDDGVVNIHLGSRTGLGRVASQVLRARDFLMMPTRRNLAFGYSLSGGTDFDRNGYADLVIGSINADAVVAVFTRPMFAMTTDIARETITEIKQWKSEAKCAHKPNDELYLCVQLAVKSVLAPKRRTNADFAYNIVYHITWVKRRGEMFEVEDIGGDGTPIAMRMQCVSGNNASHDHTHTVYVRKHSAAVEMTSIRFRIEYTYQHNASIVQPIIDTKPEEFLATFSSSCPETDKDCATQLRIESASLWGRPDDGTNRFVLGRDPTLNLQVNVSNRKNSAFDAVLSVKHESNLKFVTAAPAACEAFSKWLVRCDLGNPFVENATTVVRLRFEFDPLETRPSAGQLVVYTNTTSRVALVDGPHVVPYHVASEANLICSGHSEPDPISLDELATQGPTRLDDIGPEVRHVYRVKNPGPSSAYDVKLVIQWPCRMVATHEPYLYLVNVPQVLVDGHADGYCEPNDAVNHLRLVDAAVGAESDDQTDEAEDATSLSHSVVKRSLNQSATMTTGSVAAMVKLTCHLAQLSKQQEAAITVTARMWTNAELLENTRDFQVDSQLDVSVPGGAAFTATAQTTIIPPLQHTADWVRQLAWTLGALIGALCLALISCCLSKGGFFKRTRVDQEMYREVKQQADNVRQSMRFSSCPRPSGPSDCSNLMI